MGRYKIWLEIEYQPDEGEFIDNILSLPIDPYVTEEKWDAIRFAIGVCEDGNIPEGEIDELRQMLLDELKEQNDAKNDND